MRNGSSLYITHIFIFSLGVLSEWVVFYQVQSYTQFPPFLCGIMHLLRKDLKRAKTLLNLLQRLRCRPKIKFIRDSRVNSCDLLTSKQHLSKNNSPFFKQVYLRQLICKWKYLYFNAILWLKHCRYDVKHYSINQCFIS